MNTLIWDMRWEIMKNLSYGNRRILASVDKEWSQFYRKKQMGKTRIAGIDVFFGKKELLDEILVTKNRFISINAPPSWGKSLMCFLIPFYIHGLNTPVIDNSERYMIFVPSKLITMYIDEITKMLPQALNKKSPMLSPIIFEKGIGRHEKYLSTMNETITNLSSHNRVFFFSSRRPQLTNAFADPTMNVIVDEAHINTRFIGELTTKYNNRMIFLSATPFKIDYYDTRTFSRVEIQTTNFNIPRTDIVDLLPEAVFHSSEKSFETILERNLMKRDKIVIIGNNPKRLGSDIELELDKFIENKVIKKKHRPPVFRFISSIRTVNAFTEHKGKAILVADYARLNVGISIQAEAVILHDCHNISYEQLYQIVSRVLRITNKIEKVYITAMFMDGDTFFMRIKKALVTIKLSDDVTLSNTYLNKKSRDTSLSIMNQLGIDYKTLPDVELLMYIAPNAESLKQLFIKHKLIHSNKRKEVLFRLFY